MPIRPEDNDINFKTAAEARQALTEAKDLIANIEYQLRSKFSPNGHPAGTYECEEWRRKATAKAGIERIRITAIRNVMLKLEREESVAEGSAASLIYPARENMCRVFDKLKGYEEEIKKLQARLEDLEEKNAKLREENADLKVRHDGKLLRR